LLAARFPAWPRQRPPAGEHAHHPTRALPRPSRSSACRMPGTDPEHRIACHPVHSRKEGRSTSSSPSPLDRVSAPMQSPKGSRSRALRSLDRPAPETYAVVVRTCTTSKARAVQPSLSAALSHDSTMRRNRYIMRRAAASAERDCLWLCAWRLSRRPYVGPMQYSSHTIHRRDPDTDSLRPHRLCERCRSCAQLRRQVVRRLHWHLER
jgi:hypothetical protein